MPEKARVHAVTRELEKHYSEKFNQHGATPAGVDWKGEADHHLRYDNMLAVLRRHDDVPTLLDVGCGYGGLASYAVQKGVRLQYTGIDVSETMIQWAKKNVPNAQFMAGDVLYANLPQFDYVICNGVLTQKLTATSEQMHQFCHELIQRMFSLCQVGIAFNVMSSKVNFTVDNLYYHSPVEMLEECLKLTRRVRLDHAYPLYEYTTYLYRE